MPNRLTMLLANERLHLMHGESVTPHPSLKKTTADFPLLAPGQLHEWFAQGHGQRQPLWKPSLTLLAALALSMTADHRILWIGRRCWPTFHLLCSLSSMDTPDQILQRSIFLDPLSDAERFWAMGQGLRSAGVGCVVADAGNMNVTESRRLQVAAESGRTIGLLARPPWEIDQLSFAATRWLVRPHLSASSQPQWEIELTRCRGRRPAQDAPQQWIAQWNYQVGLGTATLHFSPDVGRQSGDASIRPAASARIS